MAEPREHPILFTGEMVRAILAGRKTQTRRVVKPQPILHESGDWVQEASGSRFLAWPERVFDGSIRCPYGGEGDRLWVRETWRPFVARWSSGVMLQADHREVQCGEAMAFVEERGGDLTGVDTQHSKHTLRWRPSIHMPRWASRITLPLAGVLVERLQDITADDARAEGYPGSKVCGYADPVEWFRDLWDSINARHGFGWSVNPWVWVPAWDAPEVRS